MPIHKNGSGSCQEFVMPSPDLGKLPILKCWPLDGGRFITLPLVNTLNPQTGTRNVGMYRMQVFSPDSTGMHWHRHKTGARHYEAYKKAGEIMPVAVVLGGDPVYTYAATAPLPDNIDEYIFAGFLRNKPVELVKCLTQKIEVPADADFVLEGYVDPSENLAWEGHFGDHTGFYSLADWYPIFHLTCITHRKNAIYPATIVGIPPQEDAWIAKATERIFLTPIRMAIAPEIIDLNLPIEGVAHNLAIVKIDKSYPGQAFKIMNAMWGAGQMMFNKVMVVVNSETDIFSSKDVLKAVLSNATDINHFAVQMGPADVLDHAAKAFTYGGKLCIDATVKLTEEITLEKSNEFENVKKYNLPEIQSLLNKTTEVTGFNALLIEEGFGVLFLGMKKNRKGQVYDLILEIAGNNEFFGIKYFVVFDHDVSLKNISILTWLALSNIDPVRDCYFKKAENSFYAIIDATRKNAKIDNYQNEWPSIISMDKETILNIDKKWASLGMGNFIQSPSLF